MSALLSRTLPAPPVGMPPQPAVGMRYLFIHQNAPGQYLHVLRRLAANPANDVVMIGLHESVEIPGVRRIAYSFDPRGVSAVHHHGREFHVALARAEAVAAVCLQLQQLGFTPDVVIGHAGWGELLNIQDVWPGVPVLGYYEFYYQTAGADVGFDPEFPTPAELNPRVRAKNAVNLLTLQQTTLGQTPTRWQLSTYPDWARRRLRLLPEGVDLAGCAPDPEAAAASLQIGKLPAIPPGAPLLTYVARNLEPYRGFHVFMRALPRLLQARPDLHVMMVGGDGVSYGMPPPRGRSYRQMLLEELRGQLDPDRIHFAGRIPFDQHVAVLQRSDVHVYLTYPFVASWSLREAMACGCCIVASDTPPVQNFLANGRTALLTPFFDADALAESILRGIEDTRLARRLRAAVRRHAERTLDIDAQHAAFDSLVQSVLH